MRATLALVGRVRVVLAIVRRGARLRRKRSAAAPGWTEVTIAASDATPLACAYLIPNGTAPAGGWPGVILFHGLGQSYADMEPIGAALRAVRARDARLRRARHRRLRGQVRARRAEGRAGRAEPLRLVRRPQRRLGHADRSIRPLARWRGGLERGGRRRPLQGDRAGDHVDEPRRRAQPQRRPEDRPDRDPLPGRAARELGSGARPGRAGPVPGQRHAGGHERRRRPAPPGRTSTRSLCRPFSCRGGTTSSSTWTRRPPRGSSSPGRSASTSATSGIRRPRTRRTSSPSTSAMPSSGSRTTSTALDRMARTTSSSPTIPGTRARFRPCTRSSRRPGRRASTSRAGTLVQGPHYAFRSARLTGGPHETFGDGSVTVHYSAAKSWTHLVATISIQGRARW